jgi:hypothetical protein
LLTRKSAAKWQLGSKVSSFLCIAQVSGSARRSALASGLRVGEDRAAMRLRILAGTVLLILGLAIYAAFVIVVVSRLWPNQTLLDLAFYAVAGILWIFPAARLTRWMSQAAPHHPPPGASP